MLTSFVSKKLNQIYPETIVRYWLGGSEFKTHLLNSFHLLFPIGERYFVKSMAKFQRKIEDPKLKKEMREFIKQEMAHAMEHEKFIKNLDQQGYPAEELTTVIEFVVDKVLTPVLGDKVNLSTTAGLEHFTSLLAQLALSEEFLKEAHPALRKLFEWHALEEIEHRSVAFDVLQAVDRSYFLRSLGLVNAYATLSFLSISLIIFLTGWDRYKDFSKQSLAMYLYEVSQVLLTKEKLFFKSLVIALKYLAPSFHPGREDLEDLVAGYDFCFDFSEFQSHQQTSASA